MRNLAAEMVRYGVTNLDLQTVLSCSGKTVANKVGGVTEFSVGEAFKIRDALLRIEYLFASTE